MRKKEHISNCEIAKKIIPFYNSYNYAGLRRKSNKYTHDDFCVSDNDFDEEEEEEYSKSSQNSNFKIYDIETNEEINETFQRNRNFSNEINVSKKKKKRKNIILESSYDSESSNYDSENNLKYEDEFNENDKEISDNYNNENNVIENENHKETELFSSSPILPSLETCMENLFNNDTSVIERVSNADNKSKENSNNELSFKEQLNKNNTKSLKNKNEIKDPLNLFSDELNNSTNISFNDKTQKKK